MAYDEQLADRVRLVLAVRPGVDERRMFGGLSFLVGGKMCCGVLGGELIVRLSPLDGEKALAEPHTRPMDFTGRPMKGWIYVAPAGLASDDGLRRWVEARKLNVPLYAIYRRFKNTVEKAK